MTKWRLNTKNSESAGKVRNETYNFFADDSALRCNCSRSLSDKLQPFAMENSGKCTYLFTKKCQIKVLIRLFC